MWVDLDPADCLAKHAPSEPTQGCLGASDLLHVCWSRKQEAGGLGQCFSILSMQLIVM